jgi:hypothetical protein
MTTADAIYAIATDLMPCHLTNATMFRWRFGRDGTPEEVAAFIADPASFLREVRAELGEDRLDGHAPAVRQPLDGPLGDVPDPVHEVHRIRCGAHLLGLGLRVLVGQRVRVQHDPHECVSHRRTAAGEPRRDDLQPKTPSAARRLVRHALGRYSRRGAA